MYMNRDLPISKLRLQNPLLREDTEREQKACLLHDDCLSDADDNVTKDSGM